jgi:Zn-dependent M28 family amino/carboxypeptidase
LGSGSPADKPLRAKWPRILLVVALSALGVLFLFWFHLTQPVLTHPAVREVPVNVSPSRLEAHVRAMAETFHPRDYAHTDNLDRAAAYIREEFQQAGGQVFDQAYQVEGATYRNAVAWFGPDTRERLVIGAHYDAVPNSPGADDNASGVAGLIELAHLLGKADLPMRVELVGFTLEETYFATPFMGSAVHARTLKEQDIPVRAMMSLEMIGYFRDDPDSQSYPLDELKHLYPSVGNFIAVVGRLGEEGLVREIKTAMQAASPLPVYSINAPPTLRGVSFSDHKNYWAEEYPAVMVTNTAFFRNPHYHTPQDTPDRLDYVRMAQVVKGVFNAVLQLAEE